ncbi:efflux RND transporter periplasmic adaptor subunit [Alistipes sp.]|uniref:efflux RND transporter periplasmic adaptor subunit n=1 Tax=Alistipes sp. TaxID=1872444 RepID=UPI003A8C0936
MKKIFIPLAVLVCACSNSGTTPSVAPQAAAQSGTAQPSDTTAVTEAADYGVDAASGATSVPNETLFNGILVIPPQNHATVTLTMGGSIRSTSLLAGAYVTKGEVLATLENPEFIALQQSYLDSHAQNEYLRTEFLRQQTLSREEASSQKRFQQSKAEYLSMRSRMDAAAAQLALLGIDTMRLLNEGIVPCLEIKAPISGYAADVRMNVGRHFGVGEPLCEIVDKSHMMLCLTAYEKDLPHVKVGDRVEFRVNGLDQRNFHGEVTMIGQQVNRENRSIDVYVRIAEQDPQFRPGMYAIARIERK